MKRYWPVVRTYLFDAVIVIGAVEAAVEVAIRHDDAKAPGSPLWVSMPLAAALVLPLLARRRFPFAALASVGLGAAVASFLDSRIVTFTFAEFLAVLSVCFLFGLLSDLRQSVAGFAVIVGAGGVVDHNDPSQGLSDFLGLLLLFAIVWIVGLGLGRKLGEVDAAKERAAQLEREREAEARAAVAEERARIARELHDVVGHSVSVMTVQASAARRLLRPDQEREREALLVVEQTGREALAEMRRLVGVLRRPEEAPALAPQPSLEHLHRLVQSAREAGLAVDVQVEGRTSQLPPGLDLTAYRLVQEGLTNALKHARASHAEVLVRYGEREVEIVVSDNGDGGGDGGGGGHGLVGMRERVAVYGGQLETGPEPDGGFALRARLPLG